MPDVVTLAGAEFEIPEKVSHLAIMEFASLASQGVDADTMEGYAAAFDLIRAVIRDEDWPRFRTLANRQRVDTAELMEIVGRVLSIVAARPTGGLSDSSAGQPNTSLSSVDGSSSEVIARMEREGRPSIAYMVRQADQGRGSLRSA